MLIPVKARFQIFVDGSVHECELTIDTARIAQRWAAGAVRSRSGIRHPFGADGGIEIKHIRPAKGPKKGAKKS